jgi:hypothetical protein
LTTKLFIYTFKNNKYNKAVIFRNVKNVYTSSFLNNYETAHEQQAYVFVFFNSGSLLRAALELSSGPFCEKPELCHSWRGKGMNNKNK